MSSNYIKEDVGLKLKSVFGDEVFFNESLKSHNTFLVGGNADCLIRTKSLRKLLLIERIAKRLAIPKITIGFGSNILFSDNGYHGIVVDTKGLCGISTKGYLVTAYAGVSLNKLIITSKKHNLSGLEYLYGIPATVGGAIAMNAGAFGSSISDLIESVKTIKDGKIVEYKKSECDFNYRSSRFLIDNETIVSATFKLKYQDKLAIDKIIEFCKVQRSNKPKYRTCGSVFKNPDGKSAGAIIESLGLKGYKIGKARVSESHANFIVAEKGCSALDIYLLINYIKKTVKDKSNVILTPEVRFVGEF